MSPTFVNNVPVRRGTPLLTVDALENDSQVPSKRGPPEAFASSSLATKAKHPKGSSNVSTPSPPIHAPLTSAIRKTRVLYEEIVAARYPGYKPKSDFELIALAIGDYSHVAAERLEAVLAKEWSSFTAPLCNVDVVMADMQRSLEEPAEITGEKPLPGESQVTIIVIPESQYSLRMWPASVSRREYCLDFVQAADTNTAVNAPPGYHLTAHIPMGSLPWLGVGGQALTSLEANFGVQRGDLLEGEEKFILRDRMICVLEYPEDEFGSGVSFEVPVRPSD